MSKALWCSMASQHPGLLLGLVVVPQRFDFLWNVSTKASRKQFEVFKHNFRNVQDAPTFLLAVSHPSTLGISDISYRLCVDHMLCLACFGGGVTECVSVFLLGTRKRESRECELFQTPKSFENKMVALKWEAIEHRWVTYILSLSCSILPRC